MNRLPGPPALAPAPGGPEVAPEACPAPAADLLLGTDDDADVHRPEDSDGVRTRGRS